MKLFFSFISCCFFVLSNGDSCPPLREMMHAYPMNIARDQESFPMGSIVHYTCRIGYSMEGDGRLKCTKNALNQLSWTIPTFTCNPVTCDRPDAPANGWVKGATFTFGHFIEYRCRSGYELYSSDGTERLDHSPVRQCLANGQWSGDVPQCIAIVCDEPNALENGLSLYDTVTFGSRIKYSCHYGFQLKGESERWCQEDGEWSGVEPTCTGIHEDEHCEIPEGVYLGTHYLLPGPKLQYECPDKRRKVSYCTNGQWKPPVPDCNEEKEEESTDLKVTDQEENVPEQEKLSWIKRVGRKIKQLWRDFKSWF